MKKLPSSQTGAAGALFIIVVIIVLALAGWYLYRQNQPGQTIDNFEECKAAGYPIMESYPEQCNADGRNFVNTSQSLQPQN